jgi:hypothetical protein
METAHKTPKERNIILSGGRDGLVDVIEYQTFVLTQVYQNEIYNIWDKGNQVKSKRPKLTPSSDSESATPNTKRRKIQVNHDSNSRMVHLCTQIKSTSNV